MKKIGKILLLILFVAGVLAVIPVGVQAATVTRTLQPGRLYTFEGADARVLSHITVTGTGRYQYVAINGRGDVISYGFSVGRVSVNGNGRTMITPLAPLRVEFNSTRLTVRFEAGEALRQINVAEGQTLALENHGRVNQHIRTDRGAFFDAVVTNAGGGIAAMNRDVRFPQFNLPTGGRVEITATDGNMVVYFPAMWYGSMVRVRRLSTPAIVVHNVWEGVSFVLSHTAERAVSVDFEPLFATAAFSYEFITRDRLGFSVNHGEATGNRITVQPYRPMTITPLADAVMFFPYEISRVMTITQGTDAPAYYLLEAGRSLAIVNSSEDRPYNVYFASEPGGYAVIYDFTLETEEELTFGVESGASRLTIPPGGILTITAGIPPDWAPQTLAVRFAYSEAITIGAAVPTITRHTLEEGEALMIVNTSEVRSYTVHLANESERYMPVYDFTLEVEEEETFTFALDINTAHQVIPPGGVLTITAGTQPERPPQTLVIHLACSDAVTFDAVQPTAIRYALEEGESLVITNSSEERPYTVYLANESVRYVPVYDFTLKVEEEETFAFGVDAEAARLTIPPGGVLTITAGTLPERPPQTLVIRFAYTETITFDVAELIITRYILETNESVIFYNKGDEALPVEIEYIIPDGSRRLLNNTLDYVHYDIYGEIAAFGLQNIGALYINPGERIHFTNPNDEEMLFIFPTAWRDVGLANEEIATPALFRREVLPGTPLRFDNVSLYYSMPLHIYGGEFDFVMTDNRNVILSYGTRNEGLFNARYNSRLTVMPTEDDESIYVIFPDAWQTQIFRINNTAHPPLHRVTIRPGDTIFLRNPTSSPLLLSNNSQPGGAGFFIRRGITRDALPIPAPTFEHGHIHLAPHQTITLTAARGTSLHIWMPHAVARQLRLV